MLTLYYSPGACSLIAHIALEEAGAAFEAERVAIAEGLHRRPEYLSINPRARAPALRVGDAVVTEVAGVVAYVAAAHPEAGLLPREPLPLARAHELLSFFASSVHIGFAQIWRAERFSDDPATHPAIQAGGRRALDGWFDEIDRMAAEGWLVDGRFTAVDLYPFVFRRWARRIGMDRVYPGWDAHTRRVLERPAVARALAREGLSADEFA